MPQYKFNPDPEYIVDILEDKDTFKTSDIRMALAAKGERSPTNPINRMLNDLKDEGYISPNDYDPSHNHEWSINKFDKEEMKSQIGKYTFSEISPLNFHETEKQ